MLVEVIREKKQGLKAYHSWAYSKAAVRPLKTLSLSPCLTPSNVLPFYVTTETGSAECPGFAALSTILP